MKNPIAIATIVLSILLAGCASRPPAPRSKYTPVSPALGRTLQDRGIRLLARPAPGFSRMTGGDHAKLSAAVLFGAVGAGIGAAVVFSHAENAGRAIVEENGIADPTLRLAERVREMLAVRYGSTTSDSGLAVTVSTDRWILWKDDVMFVASVVVEDNAGGGAAKPAKPLAKGVCQYRSAADGPTADDLLADGAARLKTELDAALEHCVNQFRTRLFL